MPARFRARVVSVVAHGCASELLLEVPHPFRAEPGQFLHVYCGDGAGRILRRPYSLYDGGDGKASLLVKKVGKGSQWLAGRKVGDYIDCLGPLGRAFELPNGRGNHVLIAGGTGIAPLRFLHKRMKAARIDAPLFWGMEHGDDYGDLPDVLRGEIDLRTASRDGGIGFEGTVIGLFRADEERKLDGVYACGPKGMLAVVAETIVGRGYACFQVSLEERMACGVGACRGCAVPGTDRDGGYLAVCKDGPVFDGGEIDWERICALIPR
jgi:dihydroorotate dehydrogenase electron transfer subunit